MLRDMHSTDIREAACAGNHTLQRKAKELSMAAATQIFAAGGVFFVAGSFGVLLAWFEFLFLVSSITLY